MTLCCTNINAQTITFYPYIGTPNSAVVRVR